MELLIVMVVGLLTVAGSLTLAPRVRIASPLILVVLGVAVSFLPFVPAIEVNPEFILAGVLPPLLYSAAVAMPAMDFRREFTSIRGLAVVLVIISAVLLGMFFSWVIPGLSLWWGIALGAIVSPTDAVATSIVQKVGVSGRVASVLSGESLLNDASALVLLRSAIAASAVAVPLWQVAGLFAYAVLVAVAIGGFIGWANLRIRSRVTDPTVNTIISFTVPFIASIPAELLGASGLVAAVVAGLVTGHGAPRQLPLQHRASDTQTWRVVELVLESAIFLVMGLELYGFVEDVGDTDELHIAFALAGVGLVLLLLIRALYVTQLVFFLRRSDGGREQGSALSRGARSLGARWSPRDTGTSSTVDPSSPLDLARMQRRRSADRDYFQAAPFGWRDGTVLVWAGMRGAVTVAAAQTLPVDTPNRSLMILIAFVVAAASLLVQGGTLATVVRWLVPGSGGEDGLKAERDEVLSMLADVRRDVVSDLPDDELPTGAMATWATADQAEIDEARVIALSIVSAQREALLDARDDGLFSASVLNEVLEHLDSTQISIETRST